MLVVMPPGTVGNRIKEMCLHRGWTMSELSRRAEISLPTVRSLWYGHAKGAEWETMAKIANALDVELGDVFQLISTNNK